MITNKITVITKAIFVEIKPALVDTWVVSQLKRYNLLTSQSKTLSLNHRQTAEKGFVYG